MRCAASAAGGSAAGRRRRRASGEPRLRARPPPSALSSDHLTRHRSVPALLARLLWPRRRLRLHPCRDDGDAYAPPYRFAPPDLRLPERRRRRRNPHAHPRWWRPPREISPRSRDPSHPWWPQPSPGTCRRTRTTGGGRALVLPAARRRLPHPTFRSPGRQPLRRSRSDRPSRRPMQADDASACAGRAWESHRPRPRSSSERCRRNRGHRPPARPNRRRSGSTLRPGRPGLPGPLACPDGAGRALPDDDAGGPARRRCLTMGSTQTTSATRTPNVRRSMSRRCWAECRRAGRRPWKE